MYVVEEKGGRSERSEGEPCPRVIREVLALALQEEKTLASLLIGGRGY